MSWADRIPKGHGKTAATGVLKDNVGASGQQAATNVFRDRVGNAKGTAIGSKKLGDGASASTSTNTNSANASTPELTSPEGSMNINAFFSAAASNGSGLANKDNGVSRQLLLTFLSNLRGEIVLIEKVDGTIIEGLFDSFEANEADNTFKLMLMYVVVQPSARRNDLYEGTSASLGSSIALVSNVSSSDHVITRSDYQQYCIIRNHELKQLVVRQVDEPSISLKPSSSSRAPGVRGVHGDAGSFATDTEISKTFGRKQRELKTWTPGEDDQTHVLDESILSQQSAGNWDQFAANAKLSKAAASPEGEFNMNEYSTYLDVQSEFYKQHEAEARAIEDSILRGTSYKGSKVRHDEVAKRERRSIELQAGEDDDKAFSAVLDAEAQAGQAATSPSSNGTGKYIPPSRRRAQTSAIGAGNAHSEVGSPSDKVADGGENVQTTGSTLQKQEKSVVEAVKDLKSQETQICVKQSTESTKIVEKPLESENVESNTKGDVITSVTTKESNSDEKQDKSTAMSGKKNTEVSESGETESKAPTTDSSATESKASSTTTTAAAPASKPKSKLKLTAEEYVPSFLSTSASQAPATSSYAQPRYSNQPHMAMQQHPGGGYMTHVHHGVHIPMNHPVQTQQMYHPGLQVPHVQHVQHIPNSQHMQHHQTGYITHPSGSNPQHGYVFHQGAPGMTAMHPHSGSHTYVDRRAGTQQAIAHSHSAPVVVAMSGNQGPLLMPVDGSIPLVPVTVNDMHGATVTYNVPSYYAGQSQGMGQAHQYHNPNMVHGQQQAQFGVQYQSHQQVHVTHNESRQVNYASNYQQRNTTTRNESHNATAQHLQSIASNLQTPSSNAIPTSSLPNTNSNTGSGASAAALPSPPTLPLVPQGTPSKPTTATTATPANDGSSNETNYVRIVRKSGGWSTSTTSPNAAKNISSISPNSSTPSKPNTSSTASSPPSAPSPLPTSPVPVRPNLLTPTQPSRNPKVSSIDRAHTAIVHTSATADMIPQAPKRT